MENVESEFLVYENWQAENKSVIHKKSCSFAKEGTERRTNQWLRNNFAPNDRWFGYFKSYNEAVAFAALLPNRQFKLCSHCLNDEKEKICNKN